LEEAPHAMQLLERGEVRGKLSITTWSAGRLPPRHRWPIRASGAVAQRHGRGRLQAFPTLGTASKDLVLVPSW